MTVIAQTDWDFPLLLHVLGAMTLMGALAVTVASFAMASRGGATSATSTKLAFRTLLLGALPSFIVMRVAAQITLDEAGYSEDAAWVGIGYMTSEGGLLLLIIAIVLAGLASKRAGRGEGTPDKKSRVAMGLSGFLLAVFVITIWAMTTKPD